MVNVSTNKFIENWTELNWTDLFSEKNTGCTGQEEMPLTYTLQKQKVQSKLEHE